MKLRKSSRWLSLSIILVLAMAMGLGFSGTVAAEKIPTAPLPVLLMSAGQSTGIYFATAVADKAKLAYDWADIPSAKNIAAGVGLGGMEPGEGVHVEIKSKVAEGKPYKTLIFIMGASLKGMGASGLSVDDEIARLKSVINYCKKNDIFMVGMHVEGKAMRGKPGSDNETIIDTVAPNMDYLVVMATSNYDDKFTDIAKRKDIPLSIVQKATDIVPILETMFKLKK